MQALLGGGPLTRIVEHHGPSKACTPGTSHITRPDVDHQFCRLAGIGFGNPSVALAAGCPAPWSWTRIDGRAYWHRASQARTLNLNPATEAETVPSGSRGIRAGPSPYGGNTSFRFSVNHASEGINRTI